MWNRTTTRRSGPTRWALAASAALLMGSAQAQGVASFAPGLPTTASEGGAALTLSVELDAVQTSDVLVPIVASGTAVEGLDYERDVLEVLVPAGSLQGSMLLTPLLDGLHEGDESITLELQAPAGGQVGSPAVHTLTLLDADPEPSIDWDPAAPNSVTEGAGVVAFPVLLSGPSANDVAVQVGFAGTATLDADYAVVGRASFVVPAGQLGAELQLEFLDDSLFEGAESLQLSLSAVGADATSASALTLVITEDDPLPAVGWQLPRSFASEAAGQVEARLVLDRGSALTVSVGVLTAGTATEGLDYSGGAGTISFPPGVVEVTVPITLLDDDQEEGPELVALRLDPNDVSGATFGTFPVHRLRIQDDESFPEPLAAGLTFVEPSPDLGLARVGQEPAVGLVNVRNAEPVSRQLLGFQVVGARPEAFTAGVFGGGTPVIPSGSTLQVEVQFTPLASGLHEATLLVLDDGPTQPTPSLPLLGSALGPLGEDLLVHAGGQPVESVTGVTFSQEFGHTGGGAVVTHDRSVLGTEDDALFQAARIGASVGYSWPLPDGAYELRLRFAEPQATVTGARTFDVFAEGLPVLTAYDVVAESGGADIAVTAPTSIVDVTGGSLELDAVGVVGEALVQVVEVRAAAVVELEPAVQDFGTVDQGQPVEATLVLSNTGLRDALISAVEFEVNQGAANDFSVVLDGVTHTGAAVDVIHDATGVVPAGGTLEVPLTFSPTEHADHLFTLRFAGDFPGVATEVRGTGGADPSWGFLHPVFDQSPQLVVDYDQNGIEILEVDASESHTHEPGRVLSAWDWSLNGASAGSGVQVALALPTGPSTVELTITDDATPPFSASLASSVMVHEPGSVPGVLALFHHVPGQDPASILDAPPALPTRIERVQRLRVTSMQGNIGQSGSSSDVMAVLRAGFEVPAQATYQFLLQGGTDRRFLLDGAPVSGPVVLNPGTYALEARFAAESVDDLPATVTVAIDGVVDSDFWQDLTHDELGVPPVIHSMPTLGVETGGNAILIDGFGYFPRSELTLHWGTLQVPGDELEAWSSERLLYTSPPGTGVISVQVETPYGMSNAVAFEYSPSGPIPITFEHLEDKEVFSYLASTAAWGPDGRLWVGKVTGQLEAITFDEDWNLVSKVTYPGVSALQNSDVLGIAFDPYDWRAGEPVRVYLAHGEHYINGGGSFSGPSPYTGQISTVEGPLFDTPQVLVTGLPVSNHDHGINGLEFDHDGNLLICVGGNTNAGVKWPLIGDLPESPLSGAILRAFTMRPGFDGAVAYAFSDTGAPSIDQVDGEEVDQVAGQVEVLATGLRNSYDLALSTRGTWYATDNGPNLGYGPPSTGAATQGTLHPQEPDELVLLESGRYYGHPNRSRGRWNPWENVYHAPWQPDLGQAHTAPLTLLDSSADGLVEYRSAAFGGQLRGDLISQKWNAPLRWIDLSEDGREALSVTQLTPTLAGLDVVTGPGGALINADYSNSKVRVMVPASGLTGPLQLWDVHPWRAPRAGGGPFVLGGRSFGDLSNTLVLIGGVPAQLQSVTATRIVGTLPVGPAVPSGELVDIEVRVGTASSVLTDAFLWLPDGKGQARGRWSTGAPLPDALGEVSTAVIDGRLFVVGEGSSKTYALDLATGTWDDTLATRPYTGSHHAAQVVDGRLLLIGGLGAGYGKVQIYDPVTDTWSLGADMPWSGGSCSSAVIDGLVYVCGGIVGSSTVANLAAYDPVLDQWDASLPPMPTGVNHAASATDGRYLFVFGGRQGGNWPQPGFDNVQRFDPLTLQWLDSDQPLSGLSPMPLPRGGTGRAVFHSGRFWVLGGETSGGAVFEDVQTYDPVEDRWALDAPLPTPRHGIDPVRDGDRIWVIGGGVVAGFSSSDAVEVLQR